MKKMKKVLAGLLAATMVMGMSVTAFAEDYTKNDDMQTATITKYYVLENEGTVSPAEDFEFTITENDIQQPGVNPSTGKLVTMDDVDLPTIGKAVYSQAGATTETGTPVEVTINLPQYPCVGIYNYTITETDKKTAGVTYYESMKLVVTVIETADGQIRIAGVHAEDAAVEGAKKTSSFENKYEAGHLKLTKTVDGIMGDKSKYFAFEVTLTGEADKVYPGLLVGETQLENNTFAITGGSYAENPDTITLGRTTTIYLKNGETVEIKNLPYGIEYVVEEISYADDGYTTEYTYSDTAATKEVDTALETVDVKNIKGGTVDTGIILDSAPYILLLAVAALGMFAVVYKKREEEF